jgi:hypothetical protein
VVIVCDWVTTGSSSACGTVVSRMKLMWHKNGEPVRIAGSRDRLQPHIAESAARRYVDRRQDWPS